MTNFRHPSRTVVAVVVIGLSLALSGPVWAETVNINPPTSPVGLGSPILKYTRTLSTPRLTIPGSFIITDTVQNVGTAVASNVVVTQDLPSGWTASGASTLRATFGTIAAGETTSIRSTITVGASAVTGRYANEATVSATNISPLQADQPIDLTKPAVLGASTTLAETGANATPLLIFGLSLMAFGLVLRRSRAE